MYKFLLTVIPTLRKGKNSNGYENCINLARIQFKTMYPASELQEYQLSAISNPEKFEINNFYCNSLVHAAKSYYNKQNEDINKLKKENAKIKRKEKTIETLIIIQGELNVKCATTPNYSTAKSELDELISNLRI